MQRIKNLFPIILAVIMAFSSVQVAWADSVSSTTTSSMAVETVVVEKYELSKSSYTYNGKAKEPSVTVTDKDGNKVDTEYYTIDYKDNKNPGKATVEVSMKAPYEGREKLTFKIKLKTPSKPKLTQIKQKQFTVNLKESEGADGYEIKYSTSKKLKKAKVIKLKNTQGLQYTISGLKNKKKYYVKVRAYKSVSGKKQYSSWSKTASIKVINRAPKHDLPTEMLESYVLDSMEYVGYKVDRQKKNGTILQDHASGPRTPMKDRSGIRYGGTVSGQETVKDKSTATGRAPDLKKFRKYGMCCASYVSYYYLNYLPNIAGINTDYIKKAIKKTGMGSQTCNAWYAAAKDLKKQGKATVVDKVPNGSPLSAADLEKLEIGDLLCFSVPNQGVACGHVAVYAGTNNGEHFVAHVGSDEGPVFQTLERFENVVNAYDGCAYRIVYRFKDLPTSKYDYTVKTTKKKYKLSGDAVEPELTVLDATGKEIAEKNYTVYYKNNKKVGTGKAIVVFKGKYKGTKTAKFKITK